MFNLEAQIKEWRLSLEKQNVGAEEVLDELESHLREDVDQQMRAGLEAQIAFETAIQRLGQPISLRREFVRAGKGWWSRLWKLKQPFRRFDEIRIPAVTDFAPTGKQTLEFAPLEAHRFYHDFIGTEHLLLGLTKSESKTVSNVLRRLGVNGEAIDKEIEKLISFGPQHEAAGTIPYTPRARKALQLAAREAGAVKKGSIKAEHIFLGLLFEGSGVAALALKNIGVQLEKAREEINRELRTDRGTI